MSGQCKIKRGPGDLQLEIVLTPLFLRQRRGGGFPNTSILDYGCGSGDLLRALTTFSPHILNRIRYVGIDQDRDAVEAARAIIGEIDESLPRTTPLVRSMAECRVEQLSEVVNIRRRSFDIIHVVNLLHHLVELGDIHRFFTNTMALLKMGGYLIAEDFFFGNYPANLDWDLYRKCEGAVYWGPAELGAMLNKVMREVASYRFFRRDSRQPVETSAGARATCWFGFTYVHRLYETSVGGVYADFDRGYHYALQRMLGKVNVAAKSGAPGYAAYGRLLTRLLRKAEGSVYVPYAKNRYPKNPNDFTGKRLRKLYDEEDPFPARSRRASGQPKTTR